MQRSLIVFALLLIVWAGLPLQPAEAASPPRVRTELEFDYAKGDNGEQYPRVRILKSDYADASVDSEYVEFPQFGLKEGASNGCGYADMSYLLSMPDGLNGYWITCSKQDQKGKTTYEAKLFKFNLASKKLSLLKQASGVNTSYLIMLNPRFKGYIVYPDSLDYTHNYDRQDVQIYSLAANKLLKRVKGLSSSWNATASIFSPGEPPASDVIFYEEYTRVKKIPPNEDGYTITGDGKMYKERTMVLFPDGHTREVKPNTELASVEWKKQIGGKQYAKYYDKSKKQWYIGYLQNGKYKALSKDHTQVSADFSPNLKYMVITQWQTNPATGKSLGKYETLVVDTAKASVLYTLPQYEKRGRPHGYEWYGDNLARFSFTDRDVDGFLHLPTGIMTRQLENREGIFKSAYSGDYSKLLSSEIPNQMFIDGKPATFSGQGPFLGRDNKWYANVDDIARAMNLKVVKNKDKVIVNRNGKESALSRKEAIEFAGSLYVPLEWMADAAGAVAGYEQEMIEDGVHRHQIILYTKELTKAKFLERYPDATLNEGTTFYELAGGNVTSKRSGQDESYASYATPRDGTAFTFADQRLVSVSVRQFPSMTLSGASLHENTYGTSFSDIYGKLKMTPYSDRQFLAKQFTESRTLFTFASKNKLQLMEMHFLPE